MAADDFPTSYKDPLYASLDAATEQKLGLPTGLLAAVRTRGERSNANQVSEANAKTPYQIIPATRKAAIDSYGIDPYLSPQNASEVAGNLLKDSLQRNGGDIPLAVGEYVGGTDRSNWGPTTRAYVARVTGQTLDPSAPAPAALPTAAPGAPGQSTFDRVSASMGPTIPPSAIGKIYAAYANGQMSPTDAQQFESDVQAGHIMLPQGGSLKTAPPAAPANQLPNSVVEAYVSGKMGDKDRQQLWKDVNDGFAKLPDGLTLGPQPTAPDAGPSMGQSIVDSNPILATGQFLGSQVAGLGNAVVSGVRRLGAAAGTLAGGGSVGDALMNAGDMPEGPPLIPSPHAGPLAQAGNDAVGSAFGKLAQGTHAVGELVRQATPGMAALPGIGPVIQGLQAAGVDPGAALGAATDAGGQVFGPALLGKVGGGVVGAVDAIRRTPTLTAESMALPEIDPARAVVADVPADPATAAPPPAPPAATDAPGAPAASQPSPAAPEPAAAPVPAAGDAVPAGSSVADVAAAARKAADGKKGATDQLVDIAAPSPKTTAAADRLGIGDYLQSDHVTTNDGYRQVVGVLKSDPTSELALAEKQGLGKVAERASNLIDEVGGTTDLSSLDSSIKKRMTDAHTDLKGQEDALYSQVRKAVPAASDAPAANTLEFIAQRAKDLGGEQNLTPMEKQIVAKLSPKGGTELPAGLEGLSDSAKAQVMEQLGGKAKQPTYALLDDVRKDVGANASRGGPFGDADTGLAKQIYSKLSADQGAAADAAGAGDLFARAKAATVVRKGMENDLSSLFGKNLDGSLVGDVGQAMKAASNGDTSKLINVLRATPDALRPEIVASGLQTVFRNAATRGEINFTGYAKWYEGLLRNKQAHAAVMSNLPKAARKQLSDLYRVSKGISDSLNARIKTGLRSSVLEAMNAPESLATKMFQMAGHAGKGVVAAHFGGPAAGMGAALMSALSKNKGSAVKAIDTLLTSPEFVNLARQAGTPKQPAAVSAMANSAPFRRFMRSVDQQNATAQWRENWISSALAAPAAANHRN